MDMWSVVAPYSQTLKRDKNVKTFLKGEQIQLLQRKVYRKETIIRKMQPLLNA